MKKLIVILLLLLFSLNISLSSSYDEFFITTDDGLQIILNENGEIISVKINDEEITSSASLPFWIKDFTPDYQTNNLIFNGGFEIDDNGDGIADGWQPHTLQGEMNITLDGQNVHSGNYSLRMFSYSYSKSSQMAYVSSPIEIKEKFEYCLTLFAKNAFGFLEDWWSVSMYVICIFYDNQGNEIGQEELQIHCTVSSWKQFSKIFISPENTREAKIVLFFSGPKENSVPGMKNNTAWFDDVCLYELPEEIKMRAAEGRLREEGDKLFYEGKLGELDFTASYGSRGDYIKINGEIYGNSKEKAIDVYFFLPINATQWKWWDDIRNWEEIESGVYQMLINADESSYLPVSPYPFSAITNDDTGISIAIPLSKPRIFRIFYDTNLEKFGISFSFGLSPLTKFNSVNFTIYLYKCDAEWGFRSALNRYYNFFPEYFDKSIDSKFMNSTGEYADFGIRFVQGHFYYDNYAKYLPQLNENNIYACEYTLPSEFEPHSLQSITEPSPDYEEFLNLIDYYARHGNSILKMKARGAKNSTIYDINGDVILAGIIRGSNWAPDVWVGEFPLNTDPDLPNFNMADAMMETLIKPAFENAEKYNAILNGVELDSFMKKSRYIDMNSSRFQYTNIPLVYSPNNFKPGVHGMAPIVEYLRYLSKWLDENHPNAKITGNCVEMGVASFGFPYLSALPFEMNSLTDWNFNDIELNYRRSMAYHRFVMAFQCGKMWDERGKVIMPYVQEFINESIFYGIYPIMKGDFFTECNYGTARPIYKKIIPILDELYLAGWEPITYAKATNGIWVERFGNGSTVYVTVRNNDSISKEYELIVEAKKLGIERNIHVMEMLSNANISYEYEDSTVIIHDSIKSKETKIFKFSNVSMLNIEIIKPKQNWLYIFNTPIIPLTNTVIIGKVTVETSVYSSEEIEKIEFYIDNVLKNTDYDKPYQWQWDEFAVGEHEIKVRAYDEKGNKAEDKINVTIFNIGK
ncbi:MAG TPA: hypothetical protein ENI33_06095 [Thermoplasmatales archaeon]|nr:hypothetical protein [Thermoplasmatales archaeon]